MLQYLMRITNRSHTFALDDVSVLDEATEGSNAGARAYHDHRHRVLERKPELRLAHKHRDQRHLFARRSLQVQPAGGDTFL